MRGTADRLWPAIVVCAALFAGIAFAMHTGAANGFDQAVLLAMRHGSDLRMAGPKWLHQSAIDITALGSSTVLFLMTAVVAIILALDHGPRAAVYLTGCVVSGDLLMRVIKVAFERLRPEIVPHAVATSGPSFPSGHAMLSTVTYFTLAWMVSGSLEAKNRPRAAGIAIWIVAAVLILLIGVTRLYLGVHWPTDVLAGWAAGAAWAMICGKVAGFDPQNKS